MYLPFLPLFCVYSLCKFAVSQLCKSAFLKSNLQWEIVSSQTFCTERMCPSFCCEALHFKAIMLEMLTQRAIIIVILCHHCIFTLSCTIVYYSASVGVFEQREKPCLSSSSSVSSFWLSCCAVELLLQLFKVLHLPASHLGSVLCCNLQF